MRSGQGALRIHKLNLRACNDPNKSAESAKNISTMFFPRLLSQNINRKRQDIMKIDREELRPILSTPPEPASKTAEIAAEELANVLQVLIEISCGAFCWRVHGIRL